MALKVLIYGFGNPGRLDDGLGPAFAEAVQERAFEDLTVESGYQLNVEDAALVADREVVIFVDAAVGGPEPFSFCGIEPGGSLSFSSHSLGPEVLLALAGDLFGVRTRGYILGIRGYEFDDFGEGLSAGARRNLESALRFIERCLGKGTFDEVVGASGRRTAADITGGYRD